MKSDKLVHYMGKYFFLFFSIGFYSFILNEISKGISKGEWNLDLILVFGLLGTASLIPFLYFKDKFAIIEFGNQKLKILQEDEAIEVSWLEVKSIKEFRHSNPMLYILRINNREGFFVFGTDHFLIDDSDIANLIEKKKRELGI